MSDDDDDKPRNYDKIESATKPLMQILVVILVGWALLVLFLFLATN